MSNGSISKWVLVVVFLSVMIGVVGGGVMGGVAGYYVALNRPAAASFPQAAAQLVSTKSTSQPTITSNISVTEDSAVIDAVKKAEPAVVTVVSNLPATTGRSGRFGNPVSPFGSPNQGPSAPTNIAEGSGFIIDQQGHIVTNEHVIDGASSIDVIYQDGTKVSAKLVGADTVADIAVLQVTGNVPGVLPLGDSNSLQLGETVIAIGSPLGSYRGSVTAGIVSGLNRTVDGTGQENLIQTDAAINHGNSGGPLLNLAGQVIGINALVDRNTTSGDPAQGLGFAIPSSIVSTVTQQLMTTGQVSYPFIGISYAEITPQTSGAMGLPVQQGVLVQDVTASSPAAQAGLQPNDIITALNNTQIDSTHALRTILFQYHAGDTVTLTVLRNGQTMTLKLTLTSRPAASNAGAPG